MSVILLTLASAFFVGLNNVLIRKGLDHTSQSQATLVSLLSSTLIFLALSVGLGRVELFFASGAIMFLLSGLLGPGLGRTLNITSLKRIGVSRTIPVIGIAPFFATIFAILFMGEEFSLYIFGGMMLIVWGVFILSRRPSTALGVKKQMLDKKDLLIPLAAALFGGISIATTKIALNSLADPIVGSTLALGAALGVVAGYMAGTKQTRKLNLSRAENIFPVLGGCAMAAGFFLNFSALEQGSVSIVASLFSTFPLFGVFLSHFLLKEQITSRTWLGAIIIILGIVVIQVF